MLLGVHGAESEQQPGPDRLSKSASRNGGGDRSVGEFWPSPPVAGIAGTDARQIRGTRYYPGIDRLDRFQSNLIKTVATTGRIQSSRTPPPTTTLGSVVADGRNAIVKAPWVTMYPGLTNLILVLSLNLSGNGKHDALDPTRRQTARRLSIACRFDAAFPRSVQPQF